MKGHLLANVLRREDEWRKDCTKEDEESMNDVAAHQRARARDDRRAFNERPCHVPEGIVEDDRRHGPEATHHDPDGSGQAHGRTRDRGRQVGEKDQDCEDGGCGRHLGRNLLFLHFEIYISLQLHVEAVSEGLPAGSRVHLRGGS